MSRLFIEKGYNLNQVEKATKQQDYIRYLTVSEIQKDVESNYLDKICEAGYKHKDPLFKWVNMIFQNDNFKSFYKYTRYPLISSKIAKEDIEKSLRRVFFSDDSHTEYTINGKRVEQPEVIDNEWTEELFHSMLYNFNDIIIHDLEDTNLPYRKFVSIADVTSIKTSADGRHIKKIAYKCIMELEGEIEVEGNIYLDDEVMAFYPLNEEIEPIIIPHDIDTCPAVFVSPKPFSRDEPIIRESIFSRVRADMEKLVFLNTLQIMAETNGAFPVVVKIRTEEEEDSRTEMNDDLANGSSSAMAASSYKSHQKEVSGSITQAGHVHEVSVPPKPDGTFDTSVIKDFAHFLRSPVDSLKFIDERISAIKADIIKSVVGDYAEQAEAAMNEMQVSKSYISKQDRLRSLAQAMSKTKTDSDKIMLAFAYGRNVYARVDFGTDFFIETADDLFNQFKSAPNPIERGNILNRLIRVRSQNNPDRFERESLLYELLPFQSGGDFDKALGQDLVTTTEKLLQMRFQYFIAIFETDYGDLVEFYYSLGDSMSKSQKVTIIKNLLNQIITDYVKTSTVADG